MELPDDTITWEELQQAEARMIDRLAQHGLTPLPHVRIATLHSAIVASKMDAVSHLYAKSDSDLTAEERAMLDEAERALMDQCYIQERDLYEEHDSALTK